MTTSDFAILLTTGIFAGLLGGLLGIGGSIVCIPIMTLGLGIPIYIAQTAAMLSNIFVALPATIRHYKNNVVNVNSLKILIPAGITSIIIGVLISAQINQRLLEIFFGCFLAYVVFSMIKTSNNKKEDSTSDSLHIGTNKLLFGGVGATGGMLAGILGIGGGTAIVPLLHKACKFRLKTSIGTSSGMMIVTAAIGSIAKLAALPSANFKLNLDISGSKLSDNEITSVFLQQASLPISLAAALIPTAIVGSWLGATLLNKLPVHIIRILFTFFVAIASYKMLSG